MIIPKNISVVNDDRNVKVNFVLPGYMESCQLYRRVGLYTDVTIHCLHPNSGDVTVYFAHSVLLSTASSYFSFILAKAFSQLSEMRTGNLKRALRIIKNDNSFQDDSLNFKENILNFDVQTFQGIKNCNCGYGTSVNTFKALESENKRTPNEHSKDCQNGDSHINNSSCTFTVNMRAYISANNVVLVVNGIEPSHMKYVLNCMYSESFLIDKRDINIFLSFIIKIKLTNYGILNELLQPFMENLSPHILQMHSDTSYVSENLISTQQDGYAISAFKSCKSVEEFAEFNSFYDILQRGNAAKLASDSSVLSVPLDLSRKCEENNQNQNNEQQSSYLEVKATTTENIYNTYTGNAFVSNAMKTNVTNIIYNSRIHDSSCYPYFSSKNHVSIASADGINQTLKETNLTFIDKYKSDLNATYNCNVKRKSNVLNSESLPTTSGVNITFAEDRNLLHIDNWTRKCDEVYLKSSPTSKVTVTKRKINPPKSNMAIGETKFKFNAFDEHEDKKQKLFRNDDISGESNNMSLLKKLERYSSLCITRLDLESQSLVSSQSHNEVFVKLEQGCDAKLGLVQRLETVKNPLLTKSICVKKYNLSVPDLPKDQDVSKPNVLKDKEEILLEKPLLADEELSYTCDIKSINNSNEVGLTTELIKDEVNNIQDKGKLEGIKCFGCDFSSREFDKLITHIKIAHIPEKVRISRCVDVNCPVQLLFCSREWEAHILHHFENSFYQCSHCTYSTKTKKGILRHESIHKGPSKKILNPRSTSLVRKQFSDRHMPRSCVKRNIKKTYPSNKNCSLKGKIKYSRANGIKIKDVFETESFCKLKRGISKRAKLFSNSHRSIFELLTLPRTTFGKMKTLSYKPNKKNLTLASSLSGKQRKMVTQKIDENNTDSNRCNKLNLNQDMKPEEVEANINDGSSHRVKISVKVKSSNFCGKISKKGKNLNCTGSESRKKKSSCLGEKKLSKGLKFEEKISNKELHIGNKNSDPANKLGIKGKDHLNTNSTYLQNIKGKEKPLNCNLCDVAFTSQRAATKHYYLCHSFVLPSQSGENENTLTDINSLHSSLMNANGNNDGAVIYGDLMTS